ncbi:MAG: Uma2 family endonuclease [Moorea sp. SIO1F2]|uniref:Uma2 family endonuclease n=1 Tax=Moorena sp. SIO1F2 TaxID=2607819 RepID=UPI0013B96A21|nr:Uma2 family endonuclease [Moorena sp. SIO1F2]NEN94093.1 Uma2 family endonuclease [Moorena sp. SIO3I7]NET80742.1 Uma2 family endonuclease [Moorena sp. SIO1F2]
MTQSLERKGLTISLPDHTQLPESNGEFVKNFHEHPQSIILTDSIEPVLQKIHPDKQYAIGQDSGIYWRITEPLERGAEAPDWFYVPGVPPLLDGKLRRSYVLWQEHLAPLIALEFASGNGDEERDSTPLSATGEEKTKPGKFWVYEQIIRIPYYGIYIFDTGELEVYHLVNGKYHQMKTNERGHYPIEQLGVELGVWEGSYQNLNQNHLWLRWWDTEGNLLLMGSERAEQEKQRAEQEKQRAEQEKQRAEQAERSQREAIPKLLAMGLTVEQVSSALGLSIEEVENLE